jgi:phosphatidylglycerophosphatase A
MDANTFFVTLNLSHSFRRLGALVVGIGVTLLWIFTLGMQTFAMALFAWSIVALFETQKYFNRTGTLDNVAVDKALGTSYAIYIALSVASTVTESAITVMVALGLFWYFDTKMPSTIGWLRQRLHNGFGLVLSTLLGGIAAGLGGALTATIFHKLTHAA